MKIFDIETFEDYSAQFHEHGWVHIRNGLTAEFLAGLQELYSRRRVEEKLSAVGNAKAKDQYRYEPPPDVSLSSELFRLVTGVCQLNPACLTLSERHVNRYLDNVDPDPPAHKDRFASQIAVGLSVTVPPSSRLLLYPWDHREVNTFGMSADYRASLAPEELPEVVLREAPYIEIEDRPGDVTIFPGSAIWHLRRNGAGTVVLYLKCNDFNWDPLEEDPSTTARRQKTEALASRGAAGARAAVPSLSRRLEWFGRVAHRDGQRRPVAKLWQGAPFPLTEAQLRILDALENGAARLSSAGNAGIDDMGIVSLAAKGAVDLIPIE